MTRALHEQDVCEITHQSLSEELSDHLTGNACVIAVEDRRLDPVLPINGQQTLGNSQISFPTGTTMCVAPLHRPDTNQDTYLPRKNNERFHFETNTFDTVVTLFPKCGYFQRGPPFLDATRITKPGGTLLAVTGLQPTEPPDHDAKWWVPASDDIELDSIRILRSDDYKTPIPVSVFTVTGETTRHPDATVVTGSANTSLS